MNTHVEYNEKELEKLKKEIISSIILKEKDIISQLKEFVSGAKNFIRIEETTGKIIFSPNFKLSNAEKIFLLLLGKYLAYQYGILENYSLTLKEISMELNIKRTTLSAPILRLMRQNIINRPEENRYEINPFKVIDKLNELKKKYLVEAKIEDE